MKIDLFLLFVTVWTKKFSLFLLAFHNVRLHTSLRYVTLQKATILRTILTSNQTCNLIQLPE